jgi:hypothetical protein
MTPVCDCLEAYRLSRRQNTKETKKGQVMGIELGVGPWIFDLHEVVGLNVLSTMHSCIATFWAVLSVS